MRAACSSSQGGGGSTARRSAGGATVTKYGTILGGISLANASSLLVIEGGSVLNGTAHGGGGTLELGAAGGQGRPSGFGSQYTDFGQISVQSGAGWTVAGNTTIGVGTTLSNSGSLTNSGTLVDAGLIVNAGSITTGWAAGVALTVSNKGSPTNQSNGIITA